MIDAQQQPDRPFSAGSPFSALVVDDDDFTRRITTRILQRLGATRIIQAADGEAALARLEAEQAPVDLILCDLHMPGLDGIDTLRRLAERNVAALVVLVSSADTRVLRAASHLARDFGIGLLRTISKPISAQKLQQIFHEIDAGPHPAPMAEPTRHESPAIDAAMVRHGLQAGEFLPFYQPKVNLRTGRVVGVEALIRWMRPGFRTIGPAEFLPIILQGGMMEILTELVLHHASTQCAAWAAAGETLSVSVNLNAASLEVPGFARRLESIVSAQHADPASIIFEITEDGLLEQGVAREVLTRLRVQGFGLSIDDFGTGYSTLHQLLTAPFNELKIDQCFVKSAPTDGEAAVALASSIALAKKLGLTVVGEGVETEAQWHLLEQAGCEIAQGYAIARPMPAELIPAWVADWRGKMICQPGPAQCLATSPA